MIFDAITGFLCALPNFWLNSLTSINSLTIPEGTFLWWRDVFATLSYVFPVWSILPIIGISFTLKAFQIGYALVLRVKSFMPLSGGA